MRLVVKLAAILFITTIVQAHVEIFEHRRLRQELLQPAPEWYTLCRLAQTRIGNAVSGAAKAVGNFFKSVF